MVADWLDRLARASASNERVSRRQLARGTALAASDGDEVADERRLETVARALASPMPRRRMLAVTGAALGSAAFSWGRPGRAWASHCPADRPVNCHGGSLSTCCFPGQICCANAGGYGGCLPGTCKCCVVSDGNCGLGCCAPDATCCGWTAGAGTSGCTAGQAVLVCCGSSAPLCRPHGNLNNRCVSQCPSGEIQCGEHCCKPDQVCLTAGDGSLFCGACPTERECGDACCEPGDTCYTDRRGSQQCCPAGQQTCGAAGGTTDFCCPPDRPECCSTDETFDCCPPGSSCYTDRRGLPSCCAAGQQTCGLFGAAPDFCCPPDRPECCNTGETFDCCPPGSSCYTDRISGLPQCCPAGQDTCLTVALDKICCPPAEPECCSTSLEGRCCPPGSTCYSSFGQPLCCPAGQVVCASHVGPTPESSLEICCPPSQECCDGICCPSGRCVTRDDLGVRVCAAP